MKRPIKVIENPGIRHIKSAINELNRTVGFSPNIKNTGDKRTLISNLRGVAGEIDIADAVILTPITNWVLMKLSIGDWKFAKYENPFFMLGKDEVEAYVKLNIKRNQKWGATEITKENPLSMQVWNPFIEAPALTNEIVFQYMSDPSQSAGEVCRKFGNRGYRIKEAYVINIVNICKKSIRYLQLYQGYEYGTRKRSDMKDDERTYKNKKLYNAMNGMWDSLEEDEIT